MTLTLKRKPLVALVLLELFEDGNWIQTRKIKKMVKRTCTKKYKIHRRLGDDENRAIVIRGLKVPQRHGLASYSLINVSGC